MANTLQSDRERLIKLIDGDEDAIKRIGIKRSLKMLPTGFWKFFVTLQERIKSASLNVLGETGSSRFSSFLNFWSLNKILAVLTALLFLYLVFDFIHGAVGKKTEYIRVVREPAKIAAPSAAELGSLDYYLSLVKGKNLFSPFPYNILTQKTKEVLSSPASVPYKGLRLVGISYGTLSEAMIEDTNSGKTYFVKKGDSVREKKVIEVSEDKVLIQDGDKIVELK